MQPPNPAETVANRPLAAVFRLDDLVVDMGRATVTRDGRELPLPRLSFDLLVALIDAAPRIVSPDELMDRVWPGLVVNPETVSQRIKLLRDSLEDDPKSARYVAGVRGRGYRLVPPVVRVETGKEPALPAAAVPGRAALVKQWAWLIPVVAIAAAGIWFLAAREGNEVPIEQPAAGEALPARSVAVLAFEDRGGAAGTDILAQGIPETVLYQLSRMPGLTVIARGSSFAFQGQREDMRVIGRKLNVRYLLEGSVQTAGNRLRVTSSLIDAQTGASIWSKQFDPPLQDVFAVQDEIAIEVARAMRLTLDAESSGAAVSRVGTTSYEGYMAFLRGRALLASVRVADLPAAIESLTTAIRLDPKFASAYVLLARARAAMADQKRAGDSQESHPQAIESATQLLDEAIKLDPQSGEAYVERGYLKMYRDVAAADADMRRGLELAPNYARGYEGLAAVMFQSVARRREALEMIEKARRLDPLDPRLDVIKADYLLWGSGDTAQAAQVLEAVLERDPLYVPALVRLSDVRWCGAGKHADSVALAEQAVALDPGNEPAWRQLAFSYLGMGEDDAAESALRHVTDNPAYASLLLSVARKNSVKAGEAAYALIAAGPTYPQLEPEIALAIRMHARKTGDYRRAIGVLEEWAAVSWDGDDPVLEGQLDLGIGVAALADMMMAAGQRDRARALLEELLTETDMQIGRYGRGEIWLNDGRAMAFAMLGRPADAVATLQRQAELGFLSHRWMLLDVEPTFASLRTRPDFRTLMENARGIVAREREQLEKMRVEGLVPDRRAGD
jgi:TolB-like protein/DNA-binding winged helix-turn-helix (wHTH) protein/Tfp pilus assembly protein PilF